MTKFRKIVKIQTHFGNIDNDFIFDNSVPFEPCIVEAIIPVLFRGVCSRGVSVSRVILSRVCVCVRVGVCRV
mgnify:CR=1 FL=1